MADIVQKLSFDASQAIETINLLNQALQALNTMLGSTGAAIGQWNSVGTAAVSQFNSMKNSADAARKAIEALTNAQSKATSEAAKVNAAPSRVTTPAPPPEMGGYLQRIQELGDKLGKVPQNASDTSKRAYASAQASLAEFAQKNNLSLAQVSAAWNNNGQVVTGAANKAANLSQNVKNAFAQLGQQGSQHIHGIGLSWQQMAAIIQATAVHTLIRGFISLLREGVTEAVDFGKRIAEDVTIMGDPFKATQKDIQNIGKTIVDLSNRYGESAKGIAEGYYQELSARVGTTTESIYVLEQAMKFGIATNTSLADSDKALVGILNSYSLSAAEAGRVTDVLFAAVQRGRYHASELANILGRMNPIAHELGISLEEVMSTMNTMTVAGTNVDTAVTQMRGIFTQLLKPTKELKELMTGKWGVENVQQAIQLFGGLIPLLEALSKEAGGSTSEMAEFFKNVRALTGVVQTTNGHITRLKENFDALKNAQQGLSEAAAKLVLDTPAKRAEIAWVNLKNAFMEIGTTLLPALSTLGEVFASIIKNIGGLRQALEALIAIKVAGYFDNIKMAATAAGTQITVFQSLLSKLALFAAGFTVGYEIGEQLKKIGAVDWEKIIKDQETARKTMTELDLKASASILEVQRRKDADQLTEAQRVLAALRIMTKAADDEMLNQQKASAFVTKHTLEDMLHTQESIIQKLEQDIGGHEKRVIALRQEAAANTMKLAEHEFEFRIEGLNEADKSEAQSTQGRRMLAEGLAQIQRAHSFEEVAAGEKLIQASETYFRSASGNTKQLGQFSREVTDAHNGERFAYEALNEAVKKKIQLDQQAKTEATKAIGVEQQKYTDLKAAVEDIIEGTKVLTKTTGVSADQQVAAQKRVDEAFGKIPEIISRGISGKKIGNLADLLGVADLALKLRGFEKQIQPLKLKVDADFSMAGQKRDAFFKTLTPQIVRLFKPEEVSSIDKLGQTLTNNTKKAADMRSGLQSISDTQKNINQHASDLNDLLLKTPVPVAIPSLFRPEQYEKVKQGSEAYTAVLKQVQDALKLGVTTSEGQQALTNAATALETFDKMWKVSDPKIKAGLDTIREGVKGLATEIDELSKKKFSVGGTPADLEELNRKNKALSNMLRYMGNLLQQTPGGQEAFKKVLDLLNTDSKAAADNTGDLSMNLSNAVGYSDTLRQNMDQIAQSAILAASANQYAASGGLIKHMAFGGKGTDTVPAMLTPGEFVMNAKATRQFYSQLVAMNAGFNPQMKAGGGDVSNFGDINVSVNGGGTSRQTAREIATALRRELRRGTSVL